MSDLTHFNSRGEAHMVDVGDKATTHRVAVAAGEIRMLPETLALIVASARHWVSTVVTGDGTRLAMAGQTVATLGGAVILALGLMLLIGSFGPAHPLGL